MLKFKIDVIEELKKGGFNTYVIQKKNLIGSKTFVDMRHGIVPGIKTINTLCKLLDLQPGDFLEYIPDSDPVDPSPSVQIKDN